MALRNVILMVRDAPKTSKFFCEALGLRAVHETEGSIELRSGAHLNGATSKDSTPETAESIQRIDGPPILLMQAVNAASLSAGYTPILNFDVEDMDVSITSALRMGATLDGPIKYPTYGKVAAMRSPDGHMIGLFEPASSQ